MSLRCPPLQNSDSLLIEIPPLIVTYIFSETIGASKGKGVSYSLLGATDSHTVWTCLEI
jgi:hypothetical protein